MYTSNMTRPAALVRFGLLVACVGAVVAPPASFAQGIIRSPGVIEKISSESDRLELTANSSRILTLETRIPRVQVNNPELLVVTPLSATQIQVSAKKAGVTQINLWDENDKVYSIDVLIYGDARELELALKTQFPNSNIRVFRYSNSLVLKGMVDRADQVSPIMRLAEDYSPKIINNLNVAGVHQIMLNVKVMEVSRTKLRKLGFDFAQVSGSGGSFVSAVSGLISSVSRDAGTGAFSLITTGDETAAFSIVSGTDAFFGVLEALEQNDLLKILAEPTLTTVSGRPAQFNVGGEIPILIPQSLGTVSIEYKKYGTQVDFLPIVLGNGNLRLEVRPRVSEVDNTRSVVLNGFTIPGLRTREIDTAVEMKAGQTLALAGLIQERTEAQFRGLPIVSNIPVFGVPFRKVQHEVNEIELLILVTPEYVDAMDPHEVPCNLPGTNTIAPSNCELYFGGFLEVPSDRGAGCGAGNCGNTPLDANGTPTPAQEVVPAGPVAPSESSDAAGVAPSMTGGSTARSDAGLGLIGPIGYDTE